MASLNRRARKSGQSLVEILFALAIFTMGVATIGYLILDGYTALRVSTERSVALGLAQEGIEAVRSIRDNDFDALVPGTYGLALSGGVWTLSGSTSDTIGRYVRSVSISNVDDEIVEVQSNVSWNTNLIRSSTMTFTDYLSNWGRTKGDAADLSIDASGASFIGPVLSGITLGNTGESDITIDAVNVSCNGGLSLTAVILGGTTVFTSVTGIPAGEDIDITDYTLSSGNNAGMEVTGCSGLLAGSDILVSFSMTDGSKAHVIVSP